MPTANIWKKSEQGFLSESRNKMRRRADPAKTISHGAMVRARSFVDVAACSAVSNPV